MKISKLLPITLALMLGMTGAFAATEATNSSAQANYQLDLPEFFDVEVTAPEKSKVTNIKTAVYPGFPTDLQQPLTTLLTKCSGLSVLEETIYENRFNNVKYLNKMGADITIEGKKLFISGPTELKGKVVEATDLRAGAALVTAAVAARGETEIGALNHIDRGYENFVEKLRGLNIDAQRVKTIDLVAGETNGARI